MIITDLEYRRNLTQKIVLGGAMLSNNADRRRSQVLSPNGSSLIGSAISSTNTSATGSIEADTEVVSNFSDTYVDINGIVSSSGSSTVAIAISLP